MIIKNKPKTIKGVLFDFDGTLTRPGLLDFEAIRRKIRCPEDQTILEYLETLPLGRRTEGYGIIESAEDRAAEESIPNQGAERCLSMLKDKNLPIGIITRNRLNAVCLALEKFKGINQYDFKAIITRENALPKPDPDGVFLAAESMGVLPTQLMVVGDFRFDIMAGKAAGACTVLISNDGNTTLPPQDPEPDFIISSLDDLIEFF